VARRSDEACSTSLVFIAVIVVVAKRSKVESQ